MCGVTKKDKDAVDGAFLIAEMFAYYKSQGISLIDKLNELYKKYGYYSNYLNSYEFDGEAGFKKMNSIMESFRGNLSNIGKFNIQKVLDYSKGINGLPKSNVIKMFLSDGVILVIRPSGTEPKLKVYVSIYGNSFSDNDSKYQILMDTIKEALA